MGLVLVAYSVISQLAAHSYISLMHRVILCFGFGGCMILCTRCRNHRRRRHWTTKYLLHPVATFVLLNLAGWHRPLKRVAKVIRVECGWPPALVHLTMLSPAAVTLGKPKRPAKLDRAAFLYIFFFGGGPWAQVKGAQPCPAVQSFSSQPVFKPEIHRIST